MHLIKPGLRHQDLEGIHLPSFRFSWKLKKLCLVDFFVCESWQTAEDVYNGFTLRYKRGLPRFKNKYQISAELDFIYGHQLAILENQAILLLN
jgi:hypothetical protein